MKTMFRALTLTAAALALGSTTTPALALPARHFGGAGSGGSAGSAGAGGSRDGGHNEGHIEGYNSGIPHPVPPPAAQKDSDTSRGTELDAGGLGHTH